MGFWEIELQGDVFALNYLSQDFPKGKSSVHKKGEKFFLQSELFNNPHSAEESFLVEKRGKELIREICIASSNTRQKLIIVETTIIWFEDDDGARKGYANMSADPQGTGIMLSASAKIENDAQTQAQALQRILENNPKLRAAAEFLWGREPTWGDLYKALEEIEEHLNPEKIVSKGYCSSTERGRFSRAANAHDIAGCDARHGPSHGANRNASEINLMNYQEARSFIQDIFSKVIKSV